MKNKFSVTLLFIFFLLYISIHTIYSQQYDYSKFRFPSVKVKGLNSTVNLDGNIFDFKNKTLEFNNRSISYSLNGDYFLFTNTDVQQKTDRVFFDHGFSFYKNPSSIIIGNENKTLTNRNAQISLSKQQVNRMYSNTPGSVFGIPNKFFELDHNVRTSYRDTYTKNELNDFKQNSFNIFATVPVKIGYGRIEPMNDLFLAQFLMNDLLDAGLISNDFAQDQLFELAQLMSSVRNQRIFDFRRANIYQLTEIAGWLEKNNIPQNIKTFTTLSDNWQFAFENTRNHGKRISIGLVPWVDYTTFTYSNSSAIKETNYGVGVQAEYNVSKAVSQFVQRDLYFGVAQHYQVTGIDRYTDITNLQVAFRYGYHPTSRTTIGLIPSIDYYFLNFKDQIFDLRLNFSASYFINNRARINANFGGGYNIGSSDIFFNRSFPSYFSNTNTLPGTLIPLYSGSGFSGGSRFQIFGNVTFNYAFF